jgi:hypothetical protein
MVLRFSSINDMAIIRSGSMSHSMTFNGLRSANGFFRQLRSIFFTLATALQAVVGVGQSPPMKNSTKFAAGSALEVIEKYHADETAASSRTLHLVYWTPRDREPLAEYRERLTRVMKTIQEFYASEMERLGLGDKTFALETTADGLLKIHLVRGERPYADYDVQSGSRIRTECLPVLSAAKIDADKETLVIFCNMSNWDPVARKMSQNSPYYATGGLRNGTAWQCDSLLLDSKLLPLKQPLLEDKQYGQISVGKYNSIFVGGVCHELGHALGLPHNKETTDERKRQGTSLMGSGNQTFGDELRGEGRGSFLSLADGLRLAGQPLFKHREKGIDLPASAKITKTSVDMAKDGRSFRLSGSVSAEPAAYAVIGYIDPNDAGDYDALTVADIVDEDQRFSLSCTGFEPGNSHELRVVVCQANGNRINDKALNIAFKVRPTGVVDLSNYAVSSKLGSLSRAVGSKDRAAIASEFAAIEKQASKKKSDSSLMDIARSLAQSLDLKLGPTPAAVKGPSCHLSESTPIEASVGWLNPTINRLPEDEALMIIAGRPFARGLYAHAPSMYRYDLGGKWKRLTGFAGMADGHRGSVIFRIAGDGVELWRSPKTTASSLHSISIEVTQVRELKLLVEDSGDGAAADWGIWTDLKLGR